MAAGIWTFYNLAKRHLMDGLIDLDTDTFKMSLYTSASNAATLTLSVVSAVTGQVAEAFGYSSSGKPLAGVTWQTGASATEFRFDCTATIWAAVGGDIQNVKYAVIWKQSSSTLGRKLLCYSMLSTSQFNVTSGNSMAVTPSANGIFELN
jgi:hypothetical protein